MAASLLKLQFELGRAGQLSLHGEGEGAVRAQKQSNKHGVAYGRCNAFPDTRLVRPKDQIIFFGPRPADRRTLAYL